MNKEGKNSLRRPILLIVTAVLVFTVAQNLRSVWDAVSSVWKLFSTVTVGLCIAFVLNAPLTMFEGRLLGFMAQSRKKWIRTMQRPVSLVLTLLLTLGLLFLLLYVIIPEVIEALEMMMALLPSYAETLREWAETQLARLNLPESVLPSSTIDWVAVSDKIQEVLFGDKSDLVNRATSITLSVGSGVVSAIFSLIFAVYVLARKEEIGRICHKSLYAFLPEKAARKIEDVAHLSNDVFSGYIVGVLIETVVLAVMCFVGMKIFRFPNALLISIVVGVTQVVPTFGAILGGAFGALIILIVSPVKAVLFVVYVIILQQVENILVYPRIMTHSLGLPGIITFAAVIVGGKIGGLAGVLLGVPMAAVLYALLRRELERRQLRVEMADARAAKTREAEYAAADASVMSTMEAHGKTWWSAPQSGKRTRTIFTRIGDAIKTGEETEKKETVQPHEAATAGMAAQEPDKTQPDTNEKKGENPSKWETTPDEQHFPPNAR